ncbi:MFS transporter [Ancylobacter sp. G4_0304]|uniref:MFS transporter n=1 Tax=Ancylobacter sp. G4_0304 TaxID=3114289 RepID=UPI0039C6056B
MPAPQPENAETSRRGFVIYAIGQSVASTGTWMQRLAIGWLAWDLTHSVGWVGAMALTELVAALWVAPSSGVLVDRSNLFRLNLLLQGCAMLVALLLYAFTETGMMTIWLLWALALADATWQGLAQPARMVAVSLLAGPKHMAQAIAVNSIGFNVARSVGPAVAGSIIIYFATPMVFLVNIGAFGTMALVLLVLRPALNRPGAASRGAFLNDVVAGYRYIARTPPVATIFLMVLAFSLLGRPFTELFPAIAGQMLGGGPAMLSLLMSAQGIGALAGGAWMLRRRSIPALARVTYGAGISMALALLGFCIVGHGQIAIALIALAGLGHVMCNIGMQSLAQLFAAREFRGRTMALYGLIFRAGPAAAAALIGGLAEWFGLAPLIGASAVACALCLSAVAFTRRGVFTPERTAPAAPPPRAGDERGGL